MFTLKDLDFYSLEIDLSKYVPIKKDIMGRILDNINLNLLKTKAFSNINIALEKMEEIIPYIEYRRVIGDYRIGLSIFRNKKIKLELIKISEIRIIAETIVDEEQVSERKYLTHDDFKDLGTDFNFLVGRILGILKAEEQDINIRIIFQKEDKELPVGRIQDLAKNISTILKYSKTRLIGFRIEFLDETEMKHDLNFSRTEEEIRVTDVFEFKPSAPINLFDIMENSLNIVNDLYNKIMR